MIVKGHWIFATRNGSSGSALLCLTCASQTPNTLLSLSKDSTSAGLILCHSRWDDRERALDISYAQWLVGLRPPVLDLRFTNTQHPFFNISMIGCLVRNNFPR